jgi:type IV pilus assembly protein PilV
VNSNMPFIMRTHMRSTSGFSLLELLVTLAVLSVGLLGIGFMQVTGLAFTKTAYSRTQAMLLTSDIADRIRANEPNAAAYVGTTATTSANPGCSGGVVCSGGAAMAASDMTDWSNRVITELSTGKGMIFAQNAVPSQACPFGSTATPVAAGFMRVLITWQERSNSPANTATSGGETNGDCYQFDFAF